MENDTYEQTRDDLHDSCRIRLLRKLLILKLRTKYMAGIFLTHTNKLIWQSVPSANVWGDIYLWIKNSILVRFEYTCGVWPCQIYITLKEYIQVFHRKFVSFYDVIIYLQSYISTVEIVQRTNIGYQMHLYFNHKYLTQTSGDNWKPI